jgi:predicted alpha/beta hydrolase
MQSSSSLFPVALLAAERRGDLVEDIYRIKAANSPDASVELAITRLGLADHSARGVPVILLHGAFENRRFWYPSVGDGLGPWLVRAGYDVWIAETRGHGVSPRNLDYPRNRVADYARYDLPVIGAFVHEQSAQAPHWLGHGQGGVSLAVALAGGHLDATLAASVALFASETSRRHWPLRFPPIEWAARLLLKRSQPLQGARLKRGPEDEPLGVALEALRWQGAWGRFGESGQDWAATLGEVRVPILAVAGAADRRAPSEDCEALLQHFPEATRRWMLLGRAQGFSMDFGHVDMLQGKSACAEVWPLIRGWLEQQGSH